VTVDLLLLNATNLPWLPIFPYAFVQVSALARRAGLRVKTLDLLGIPEDRLPAMLGTVLEDTRPRAVGLHIRQGDSVFLDDYYASPNGPPRLRNYFPIDDNARLVTTLRRLTSVPILGGGFGFTTHAERLFDHLGIDVGVQGCPDDVIARFEDVLAGRDLGSIGSLIHRSGGKRVANPRAYFAPFPEREYTDETVDALVRFYGHARLFGKDPPTVPIEIMRGCPFSCFFCTEPHVKGRGIRYRDLDVVEAELEFLMQRQIRRFWLVCSELDLQGLTFAKQIAERVIRLREKHGGPPIEWSAYALPRLDEDELRLLQRAGYVSAVNDVLSLDDTNLRAARVPYRSKQAVAFLKAVTKLDREDAAAEQNAGAAEGGMRGVQRTSKELASYIGLFLGNAHATAATLRETLRRFEDEGLRENYRGGLAFPATRVFEPGGEPICATTSRGLRTYGPGGEERVTDGLAPTFYYPDFLVEKLGSPAAVIDFMRFVEDTLMSIGHRGRKDWPWFLSAYATHELFTQLLAEAGPLDDGSPHAIRIARAPSAQDARTLFAPPLQQRAEWNAAAGELLAHVWQRHEELSRRIHAALEIDPAWSEYKVLRQLMRRHATRDALFAELEQGTALAPSERLLVEWVLYRNNVVLRPGYAELLFD